LQVTPHAIVSLDDGGVLVLQATVLSPEQARIMGENMISMGEAGP